MSCRAVSLCWLTFGSRCGPRRMVAPVLEEIATERGRQLPAFRRTRRAPAQYALPAPEILGEKASELLTRWRVVDLRASDAQFHGRPRSTLHSRVEGVAAATWPPAAIRMISASNLTCITAGSAAALIAESPWRAAPVASFIAGAISRAGQPTPWDRCCRPRGQSVRSSSAVAFLVGVPCWSLGTSHAAGLRWGQPPQVPRRPGQSRKGGK